MRPERFATQSTTSEKIALVVRLLAGESLDALARETGRPRKQLSSWRKRFLAGGEASLDGPREDPKLEQLRAAEAELTAKVAELEAENGMLARQFALLGNGARCATVHPYCSEAYARAFEDLGVRRLHVAAWGTHVLVREGQAGVRQTTGLRPFGSIDPGGDLRAGFDELREAGIASVSVITDPMWSPEVSQLRAAFNICQPFKRYFVIDREAAVQLRKRHRNRINQARRAGMLEDVSLSDHLDRWFELYQGNVDNRHIPQPFTRAYFERLATFADLRTVAGVADGEIVTMSLWLPYGDTMYFHESASSAAGRAISAAHAAFAHVIETAGDCRYVVLGGAAAVYDEEADGLAEFKRGFANASVTSYICGAMLGDGRT